MTSRSAVRLSVVGLCALVPVVVSATPVLATTKVAGEHYSSLGLTHTILLFVVTPLVIFGVVGGLAALPATLASRREKQTSAGGNDPIWVNDAIWINGPTDVPLPIEAAAQQPVAIESASMPVSWAPPQATEKELVTAGPSARGGASAGW